MKGKSHEELGETHEQFVDESAYITGDGADKDAECTADDDDRQARGNGDAGTPENAAKDVPAQFVGTHGKQRIWRLQAVDQVLLQWREGGDSGRNECDHDP